MTLPLTTDGRYWLYTELVKFGSTLHRDSFDGGLYLLQTDAKGRTARLYMYQLTGTHAFLNKYAIVSRP